MQPGFFDPPAEPGLVRFGTSSFSAPEWLGTFYPRGTRPADFLRHYATQFDTVEVDATYYHVPGPATVPAGRGHPTTWTRSFQNPGATSRVKACEPAGRAPAERR